MRIARLLSRSGSLLPLGRIGVVPSRSSPAATGRGIPRALPSTPYLHHQLRSGSTSSNPLEDPPPRTMSSPPTLTLTSLEDSICSLLNDACDWIAVKRPQPVGDDGQPYQEAAITYHEGWQCEARIAGGWVRDKLLSLPSSDLDVSLSSLTGHVFALLLRQYLSSPEFAQSPRNASPDAPPLGTITRIEANPEQSKNLETATAKIFGLQLDFVNLRKEVYEEGSRIPKMSFGTPTEDAERRDITINSLFFNVHTRRVEDFTGKGLDDLSLGLVRTPLSPLTTFLDDPLRVLRCVRFASRFGYKVDGSIQDCLGEGQEGSRIRQALATKVSRERFGIEIDKMMLGPRPLLAVAWLHRLGLLDLVFRPATEQCRLRAYDPLLLTVLEEPAREEPSTLAVLAAAIADALVRGKASGNGAAQELIPELQDVKIPDAVAKPLPRGLLEPLQDAEQRRRLFLSACLLPLRRAAFEEKKGKWAWAGDAVVMHGLKLGTKNTREPINALNRASLALYNPVLDSFDGDSAEYRGRLVAGLHGASVERKATLALVQQLPYITQPDLHLSLATSLLHALVAHLAEEALSDGTASLAEATRRLSSLWGEIVPRYTALWETYEREGLVERAVEKCRLNGTQIRDALNIVGPLIPRIQSRVLAYQFCHDADDERISVEGCTAWLKEEWEKGGIVPLEERGAVAAPAGKGPKKAKQQVQQKKEAPGQDPERKRRKSDE